MNSRMLSIARFEAGYQLLSPVFAVSFVLLLLLAFGSVTSDNISMGAIGNVNLDSPYAISQSVLVFSFISMFVVIAFVANVVLRDVEARTAEMFYTTPIGRAEYLLGRFGGALAVALVLLAAVPIGILVGVQMPWLDPDRIGGFRIAHYLQPFVVFGAVNLVFAGAVAFALATLTRSMALTYVVIVGYFLLTGVISSVSDVFSGAQYRELLAMFDPFGAAAFEEVTRYWTAFERNERLVAVSGLVGWNRLAWLGLSIAVLVFAVARFRFDVQPRTRRARRAAGRQADAATRPTADVPAALPTARIATGPRAHLRQLVARSALEARSVVVSLPFLVLVLLGVLITMINFLSLEQFFEAPVYPVTRMLTQILQGTFTLSLLIVVVYYSGELVWREREVRLHEVIDATPTPGWVQVGAKMLAMLLIVTTLLAIGVATSMLFQVFNGWFRLQPGLYLTRHMLDYGLLFYVMAIFGVFVQTLTPGKFAGMGMMVLVVISFFVLDPLGFEDPLYQLGAAPSAPYSDINGWGWFGVIQAWYSAYWLFFCLLLFVAAHLLWRRGGMDGLKLRLGRAHADLTRGVAVAGVIGLAGWLGVGSVIVYNTRIVNPFVTEQDLEREAVTYEQRYRRIEDLPQPRIAAIDNTLALYPQQRRYRMQGSYRLENREDAPIAEVYVGFNPAVEVARVLLGGETAAEVDEQFNVYRFAPAEPIAPGETRRLEFHTERVNRGFRHARNAQPALAGGSATVIGNGSFVYGRDGMPYIGFSRQQILTDRNDRRNYDLPPIDRAPDLDDLDAARNSYLSHDSDWVDFRTVVSTAADQIAVVPGYLEREWLEGGRRHFEYVMDAPMQNLVAYLSGRYAVERREVDGVELSVYYHPGHHWNIDHMLDTMEKSLDYFQANFSPYQYRQMRILEFPAFLGNFAQSFPNTIQWSEGLGFIADRRDPDAIDYVFYVGAHEMAHQWWGHQVSAADVQGGTVLVETLAQYSALMVMEAEYGSDMMRRFLAFELDRYLAARGTESREELPLVRVEGQGYIHYRKGSLVMYALKDYLGEQRVNRALANLIDEAAWQYDPYPRSLDLIRHLKAVAETDAEVALIEDLFERITLWDLAVAEADVTDNQDGTWTVTATVNAGKREADGQGRETERRLDMPIDLGVFTRRPDEGGFSAEAVLHLDKHRITSGANRIEITVDQRPAVVGVDPYHKLIDRIKDDNLAAL